MSSETNKKALDLLFQRPLEPVFTARDNGKAVFDLPDSFYTEEYNEVKEDIQSRFGENVDLKIPLRDLSTKPDLRFTRPLRKRQQFSLFNPQHRKIAAQLIELFMNAPTEENFIALAAYTKDRVNPYLFQYAFAVAVQHRDDTKNIPVKPIAETFPQNFIEPSVFKEARAEAELVPNTGDRRHIEIPRNYTASDREDEQRLGYFREDIGLNSHHWHWHLVYPGYGPMSVVNKDRRGELFYYMHHQVQARYNVERLCNGLARVKPLNNLREPIEGGYYPKITSSSNNRTFPARVPDTKLQDIDREDLKLELAELERWANRIIQAIDQGFVTSNHGEVIPLDETKGIDILANVVESSALSVNPTFYGGLHNEGHNVLSYAHDPESRFLEDVNVMGDVSTSMRDPIFYRWHGFIDSIFIRHKDLLPPYNRETLGFDGVHITALEVRIDSARAVPNTLLTYMERSDVNLAAGLDFGPQGDVYATFTHLQHAPFVYNISVQSENTSPVRGTCRIFITPKVDERGVPLNLNDQRLLTIELDKFVVNLMPGVNNIRQSSSNSSVTIPYERTFRPIGQRNQPRNEERLSEFRFCGCGWPQHLLLPRGRPEGLQYNLFVMFSNFSGDAVPQDLSNVVCADSYSYCGLKDRLYPDRRSMGFPFDRIIRERSLNDFVNRYPNMANIDVVIRFNDVIVDRQKKD